MLPCSQCLSGEFCGTLPTRGFPTLCLPLLDFSMASDLAQSSDLSKVSDLGPQVEAGAAPDASADANRVDDLAASTD
jgi:hypothetical protein